MGANTLTGVYALRSFPASYSEEFISIRHLDPQGRDYEVGMIRQLAEWRGEDQELVRRSLNRRYLLRVVTSFDTMKHEAGMVRCIAQTEHGEVSFLIHPHAESNKRFGVNGRLLVDADDNHYLIPDLAELPALQRRLFQFYFTDF
jgi:hypothetical protein